MNQNPIVTATSEVHIAHVYISNEQLAFGRCRLLSAVEHSDGKEFGLIA